MVELLAEPLEDDYYRGIYSVNTIIRVIRYILIKTIPPFYLKIELLYAKKLHLFLKRKE
jgi:hypothetical protein